MEQINERYYEHCCNWFIHSYYMDVAFKSIIIRIKSRQYTSCAILLLNDRWMIIGHLERSDVLNINWPESTSWTSNLFFAPASKINFSLVPLTEPTTCSSNGRQAHNIYKEFYLLHMLERCKTPVRHAVIVCQFSVWASFVFSERFSAIKVRGGGSSRYMLRTPFRLHMLWVKNMRI